jgi:hypothetical protein
MSAFRWEICVFQFHFGVLNNNLSGLFQLEKILANLFHLG